MDGFSIAMTRRAPRWPFLAAVGVALVALAVVLVAPPVSRAWDRHRNAVDDRHWREATATAAQVRLPATYIPTDRLGGEPCDDPALGSAGDRCWLIGATPTQTTAALASALRSVGLSPQATYCMHMNGELTGPTTACRVAASVKGVDVVLVALSNVKFAKIVRPPNGQRYVPPKPHIDGTEVTLDVE